MFFWISSIVIFLLEDFNKSKNQAGKTVEEIRLELISKVGENVKIRINVNGKDVISIDSEEE